MDNYQPLQPEDVVSASSGSLSPTIDDATFRVQDFIEAAMERILQTSQSRDSWTGKGSKCAVLKPGQHWQKGRVRVRIVLEFYPSDEP